MGTGAVVAQAELPAIVVGAVLTMLDAVVPQRSRHRSGVTVEPSRGGSRVHGPRESRANNSERVHRPTFQLGFFIRSRDTFHQRWDGAMVARCFPVLGSWQRLWVRVPLSPIVFCLFFWSTSVDKNTLTQMDIIFVGLFHALL